MTAYAQSHGILSPLQFDFRSKIFAQDAIWHFIETIQHELENGYIVHAVLFNLSKHFVSLSDQILLEKPQSFYFLHSVVLLVEIIPTSRLQQVSVNGDLLEWIELKQGVPQ